MAVPYQSYTGNFTQSFSYSGTPVLITQTGTTANQASSLITRSGNTFTVSETGYYLISTSNYFIGGASNSKTSIHKNSTIIAAKTVTANGWVTVTVITKLIASTDVIGIYGEFLNSGTYTRGLNFGGGIHFRKVFGTVSESCPTWIGTLRKMNVTNVVGVNTWPYSSDSRVIQSGSLTSSASANAFTLGATVSDVLLNARFTYTQSGTDSGFYISPMTTVNAQTASYYHTETSAFGDITCCVLLNRQVSNTFARANANTTLTATANINDCAGILVIQ